MSCSGPGLLGTGGAGRLLRRPRRSREPGGCRGQELGGLATGKAEVSCLEPSPAVPSMSCSGPGLLGTGGAGRLLWRPRRSRVPGGCRGQELGGLATGKAHSEQPSWRQPPCSPTERAGEVTQGRAADCPSLRLPRPGSRQPRAPESSSWLRQIAIELGDAVHKCNCRRCTNVGDVGQDELARRIRKSTRRAPRPSEEAAAESTDEEASSGDESASEPEASPTPTES